MVEKIEKGFAVNTKFGVGRVKELGDTIAIITLAKGGDKPFYINGLTPISDLEFFTKSFEGYGDIEERLQPENNLLYRAFFERIYKSMERVGPDDMPSIKPKIDEPPPIVPKSTSTLPKIAGAGSVKELLNKKGTEGSFNITPHNPEKKAQEIKPPTGLKKLFNNLKGSGSEAVNKKPINPAVVDLDTGKVQRMDASKEVPSKGHVLSHISLNRTAKTPDQKYNYHYKVGNNPSAKISSFPLGADGKASLKHPAISGKIYLPGEKVIHGNKQYTVHSHINPLPAVNGEPDYNKMLVKDNEGRLFSTTRANVQHVGLNHSNVKPVQMGDGSQKYHHELKEGDVVKKGQSSYKILQADEKGHLAKNTDTGEYYYTFSKDYNKDFKHNEYDRNKKAEKGDIVNFSHMGKTKQAEVTEDHPDGAVVKLNKTEDSIVIPHGEYEFTGQRAPAKLEQKKEPEKFDKNKKAEKGDIITFEHLGTKKHREVLERHKEGAVVKIGKTDQAILIKDGDYEHTGKKAHELAPTTRDVEDDVKVPTSQGDLGSSDFEKRLAGSNEVNPLKQKHNAHIEALDKFVGADKKPHRKEESEDGTITHHLGLGDVKIHSKEGQEPQIENPDVNLWNAPHKVVGFNPENNTVTVVPYPKKQAHELSPEEKDSKTPSYKNTLEYQEPVVDERTKKVKSEGKYKGQKVFKMDELRGDRGLQSVHKPAQVAEQHEENKKILLNKLADAHIEHGVTDPEQIGNDNYGLKENHQELGKKINDLLSSHDKETNKINRGSGAFEHEDYSPSKSNFEEDGYGAIEKVFGSDWKQQVTDKIGQRIKGKEAEKKFEENKAKIIENKQKVIKENKELEDKPVNDYIENVYSKLPSLQENSLNGKLGIKSKPHKISTPNPKLDNIDAEFHIVDLTKGHTINSDNPSDAHMNRHTNKLTGLEKVPFHPNPQFPPSDAGTQIRNYSDEVKGVNSRKKTLDISNNFKQADAINTGSQGNTNTSVIDEKSVLMSGRSRDNAKKMLSPEKIKENKEHIKGMLKEIYPDMTEEQHKQLMQEVDNSGNPDIVRMAIHSSGEPYNFAKHGDEYRQLTKVLDDDITEPKNEEVKRKSMNAAMTHEVRTSLQKMVPPGVKLSSHITKPAVAEKVFNYLKGRGIITDAEHRQYWDPAKGPTEEGRKSLKHIFHGLYLSGQAADHLDSISAKNEDYRTNVNSAISENIDDLLDIRNKYTQHDLKPEFEEIAKHYAGKDKDQGKMLEGQQTTDIGLPTTAKGLLYLIENQREGDPELKLSNVLKKYKETIKEIESPIADEGQGGLMYGDPKEAAENLEKEIKELKSNFFKKYADAYDKKRNLNKSFEQEIIEFPKPKFILLKNVKTS